MTGRDLRRVHALLASGLVSVLAACSSSVVGTSAPVGTSAAQAAPTSTLSAGAPAPPPAAPPAPRAVVVLDPGHNGGNASAPEEIG
jgi:N-acetylmuramoyl-L-alanine amidase